MELIINENLTNIPELKSVIHKFNAGNKLYYYMKEYTFSKTVNIFEINFHDNKNEENYSVLENSKLKVNVYVDNKEFLQFNCIWDYNNFYFNMLLSIIKKVIIEEKIEFNINDFLEKLNTYERYESFLNKMKLNFTADAVNTSGFGDLIYGLNNNKLDDYFMNKTYGVSLIEIFIVCCSYPDWKNFKQRIRFIKAEKCLMVDIMFDLETMENASQKERREIHIKKINNELPPIIKKYKFKDFDLERFMADFNTYVKEIEFLTSTNYWVDE